MKTSTRRKGTYLMIERIHLSEEILKDSCYPNANTIQKKLREELGLEYSIPTIWRDIQFIKNRLNCPVEYDAHQKGYFWENTITEVL